MNKKSIYTKVSLGLFCGLFTTFAQAQTATKDTTYNRQISLERDYNPTLQDANKINSMPSVYDPIVTKTNAPLAGWSTAGNSKNMQLSYLGAGSFGTGLQHDKYRGYAGLRAGTHGIIEGEAGYQIIGNEKTKLDLFGTYAMSNGKPNYTDQGVNGGAKAKYNEALVKARFQHQLAPLTLFIDASYNRTGFNYYGARYDLTDWSSAMSDTKTTQSAGIFDMNFGVKSKDDITMRYLVKAGYTHFGFQRGNLSDTKGPQAGILRADLNLNTDFGSSTVIGLNFHAMNQSLNSDYKDLHALTHLKANPYLSFTGSNWKAVVGVNGHLTFDEQNKVLFVPNLSGSWNFQETSSLYASLTGDIQENTFPDILLENRYANPIARITPSRTYYNAQVGIKTGAIKGVELEFFGGYKNTSREHLYYALPLNFWSNTNSVIYATLKTGNIGGQIKTNLIPNTDLRARFTTFFYNVKYSDTQTIDAKAWNLPTYTLDLNADIKPIDNLVVSANYLLSGGRKYLYNYSRAKSMNAINELNGKVNYQFSKNFSGNAAINNILSQKYELYPGYASFGVNFQVGASIKF